ncbi:tautomerase family protein [Promicromonospora iranensis]|uniref:Phenylpyruvate tautomerase PptA (4-oxalocrotonate tautomerase family) n=1 Tax=Promicromonospora iranensis TaxID=1105144 RepID=A0ABU2CTY9_9MICO|nr:tautomerase family protein [Promicromonospora iranensis]MDR7384816.1 phenylpyruvate tautomerase PptA (4-oxalocrotonate tautomerase family) [Promicromonospora iranensis]
MVQVKVYGNRSVWGERRAEISDALHEALVRTWQLPADKRFHRFLLLDDGDLVAPRSDAYLVVEIVCFTGRSREAKRALIAALYDDVAPRLGLPVDDLEIVILESPRENWGIRGMSGDELTLSYRVEV